MDAAPVLKRKGAEAAPEPWVHVPATKIRRLDAEVPPVETGVGAPLAAGVPPQQAFGVGEAPRVIGDVAAPAVDATPLLKRKGAEAPQPWLDVDGVTAPATKIRRLDAEVPPVEPAVGAPPLVQPGAGVPPRPFVVEEVGVSGDVAPPPAAVAVGAPEANDERAIVVYQPAEAARNLLQGSLRPGASLRVSPDWIHALKGTMLHEASNHRALFEELAGRDENPNLAMVLWAPAHAHTGSSAAAAAAEMMDADHQDGDGASMEVEHQPTTAAAGALQGEACRHQQQQQWPPQHCVAQQQQLQLQLPAASYQSSPITWSW